MDNDLYLKIVDFVCTCKQFQYLVRQKFVPESTETLLREFGNKNIPRSGHIDFQGKFVSFWIHGAGITYCLDRTEFSHSFYLGKGLDIIFNVLDVLKFHQVDHDERHDVEINRLEKLQLVIKLFEESNVYYLS